MQSRSASYSAKATVFMQGSLPTHLYVVCSGFVKLTVRRSAAHQAVVRIAGPGNALGLFAVLTNCKYELSAHALTPVRLRLIERDSFLALLSKNQELQRRTLQTLGQDYISAHQQFCRTVLSATVDERLNQLLCDMADAFDSESNDPGSRVPLLLTQSEIATMIGSTRETVSRSLRELQKRGSILMTNSEVVLRDPNALRILS
ncbi:MAG: Crp/Fnr family transcriptional regulator [Acidobacteria bacterium]|nr:Crp/Fnr family transcriptional regulator [Acidobacteriota bacterium]